jgi:hypothetical protein
MWLGMVDLIICVSNIARITAISKCRYGNMANFSAKKGTWAMLRRRKTTRIIRP